MHIGIKGKADNELSFNERVAVATLATHWGVLHALRNSGDTMANVTAISDWIARNKKGAPKLPTIKIGRERDVEIVEQLRSFATDYFPEFSFEVTL